MKDFVIAAILGIIHRCMGELVKAEEWFAPALALAERHAHHLVPRYSNNVWSIRREINVKLHQRGEMPRRAA